MNRYRRWITPLLVLACIAASWWFTHLTTRSEPAQADHHRAALAELIALRVSTALRNDGLDLSEAGFAELRVQYPEVQSIGVMRVDGSQALQVGPHTESWRPMDADDKPYDQTLTTILVDGQPWGQTQITFIPDVQAASGWWSIATWLVTAGIGLSIVIRLLLWRRRSGRSGDLPRRVKSMLDTIAESVMVLDPKGRIVFANTTFADHVGRDRNQLVGQSCSDLRWVTHNREQPKACMPWTLAISEQRSVEEARICVVGNEEEIHSYVVNCVPIYDTKQRVCGALASLSDVTALEMKHAELEAHLTLLGEAREQVAQVNAILKKQASEDSLTGLLNRRAFLEQAHAVWTSAQYPRRCLASVMVDIDHFKSINDEHGHLAGDNVLAGVAATLNRHARAEDLLCRWGGEEFCLLLTDATRDECLLAAERFRAAIDGQTIEGLRVTASFGIASFDEEIADLEMFIHRADVALYASKRNGRNRATLWSPKLGPIASSLDAAPGTDGPTSDRPTHGPTTTAGGSLALGPARRAV